MKYILSLLLFFSLTTGKNIIDKTPKIKKQILRHYSTKTMYKTHELKKDKLELHLEYGFDKKGNQTYYINHLDSKKDTVWGTSKSTKKKVGKKTCYYDKNDRLLNCRQKQKNIVMVFFPPDLDKPVSYELHDKKGITGVISWYGHEKYPYKKAFATQRRFDDRGNLIYSVSTEYYLPLNFDPQKKQTHKISKKGLIQAGKSKIYEWEYDYYN